jgi:hypothetical protein
MSAACADVVMQIAAKIAPPNAVLLILTSLTHAPGLPGLVHPQKQPGCRGGSDMVTEFHLFCEKFIESFTLSAR